MRAGTVGVDGTARHAAVREVGEAVCLALLLEGGSERSVLVEPDRVGREVVW